MTMKFPHASVAQKLFVTKSSMEKSFFSSFILFSESALPRYESYTILAGRSRSVTKQLYRYFPKSCSFRAFLNFLPNHHNTSCLLPTICLIGSFGYFQSFCQLYPFAFMGKNILYAIIETTGYDVV